MSQLEIHTIARTMGVHHIFNGIGNQFPGWQRIQHTAVTHSNTVIYGNRVEFFGNTARRFNFTRHHLTEIFKMDMTGNELGKGIGRQR